MGRYCSYLLPKQAGGTPQIIVDLTSRITGRLRVYIQSEAADRSLGFEDEDLRSYPGLLGQ